MLSVAFAGFGAAAGATDGDAAADGDGDAAADGDGDGDGDTLVEGETAGLAGAGLGAGAVVGAAAVVGAEGAAEVHAANPSVSSAELAISARCRRGMNGVFARGTPGVPSNRNKVGNEAEHGPPSVGLQRSIAK